MRIVSWNINSIRARVDHLESLLDRVDPDVVLLQETRCADVFFPYGLFMSRGFEVAHHALDHRNGVSIASRVGLSDVRTGFHRKPRRAAALGPTGPEEARLISGVCGRVRLFSVYVPNGRTLDDPQYTYKLDWLDRLRREVGREIAAGNDLVLTGDFNVAPADLDIYDPSRFRRTTHASVPERNAIRAIENEGLTDMMRARDPAPGLYTWWSYAPNQLARNRGLRIDLVLASSGVADRIDDLRVDRTTRELPRASDHAPVVFTVGP